MVLNGLDESDYKIIWSAPEGHDYALQFRRQNERDWVFSEIAINKQTATKWFKQCVEKGTYGIEYRVVRVSRYPPCAITQIINYHKD